eukprot:8707026-Alexandrium_andersonii.AAC.1
MLRFREGIFHVRCGFPAISCAEGAAAPPQDIATEAPTLGNNPLVTRPCALLLRDPRRPAPPVHRRCRSAR